MYVTDSEHGRLLCHTKDRLETQWQVLKFSDINSTRLNRSTSVNTIFSLVILTQRPLDDPWLYTVTEHVSVGPSLTDHRQKCRTSGSFGIYTTPTQLDPGDKDLWQVQNPTEKGTWYQLHRNFCASRRCGHRGSGVRKGPCVYKIYGGFVVRGFFLTVSVREDGRTRSLIMNEVHSLIL